jgi:hypothetical protein
MNTIKECWEEFERQVLIPSGTSSKETRKAKLSFYAGIQTFLRMQHHLAGDDLSYDEKAACITIWKKELDQFSSEVITEVVMDKMTGKIED